MELSTLEVEKQSRSPKRVDKRHIVDAVAAEVADLPDVAQRGPTSEAAADEDRTDYPTGVKFWLLIATLCALLSLGGLDTNIVATAVPSITDEFHTTADVGWYSAAFRLCSCSFQFVFGKSYKFFSVKQVFILANVIFLIGSLFCATASVSALFVFGRAVTGVGFAGIIGGFFTILVHILPLQKRPFYSGLVGGIESLAIISAPIVGGLLTQSLGWRWCFWINLPIGGVTLLMIIFLFSDPKPSDRTLTLWQKLKGLDLVSNLLFIPALTSLFIALSWAGTVYAWSSAQVVAPLVVFVVLILGFSVNQYRRGDSAALPPRLLTNRNIIAGAIFTSCTNSAINVLEYYLPTYYQIVRQWTPAKSGYFMVPIVIGETLGMIVCGLGTSKLGYYTPFMILSSLTMPVFAGLITTFGPTTDYAKLILISGASGLANGVGFNAPISAVQTVLPVEDAPLGLSIVLFAQHFGPAISIPIAQVIFTNELSTNLGQLAAHDLDTMGLSSITGSQSGTQRISSLAGISRSLSQTWYFAIALTCATMVGSLLMQWRSVKKKAE